MVEGCGVDGEGVTVCLFCVFVLFVGEVGGAEIAVDGCRPGVIFQRLLVVLRGSAVLASRMIDGADVVERVGVVPVQAQGHLIGLHGLVHREQVMIGDADFCPGERLAQLRVLIRTYRCDVFPARHVEVALHLRRQLIHIGDARGRRRGLRVDVLYVCGFLRLDGYGRKSGGLRRSCQRCAGNRKCQASDDRGRNRRHGRLPILRFLARTPEAYAGA